MKKRLTAYMLACLMILLVGCSSNTVKEAAKMKRIQRLLFRLVILKRNLKKKHQPNRKVQLFRKNAEYG